MLGSKAKRELKKNQRRILIDSIEIGIPSPQQIYTWGERRLPNGKRVGEIKNSKTVNYKRFTPLRDGLFCERIFGPVNSFVCACGKRQPRADVTFCDKCEVEYTDQRTRRYRLGYIPLVSPVAHIWYLKGRPSYLSLFLGKRKKRVIALAYCNAYLVEQAFDPTPGSSIHLAPTDVMSRIQEREAHGVNRYTKNIQSSPTIRHISNLFYNSPKGNLDAKRRLQVTQLTNPLITDTSTNKSSALIKKNENKADVSCVSRQPQTRSADAGNAHANPAAGFASANAFYDGVQYSSLNHFQQKINKKTSPSLFSHLLAEVLGHIEKDVVLTDFSKKKSTHTTKNKQIAYPLAKQVSLLNKKQKESETLLSLRPLWGYTYSEQNKQDLYKFNTLLNRKEMSFGWRQEKATISMFAQAPLLSYKELLYSTPTVLTLTPSLTTKKAFKAKFTNPTSPQSSQLSLKAIYQPLFSLPIEKWLASIFIIFGKNSKKLYSYSIKAWQLRGGLLNKGHKKVLNLYYVPFSLFLIANLHTKYGKTSRRVSAGVSVSGVQELYSLRSDVEIQPQSAANLHRKRSHAGLADRQMGLGAGITTVQAQKYKTVISGKKEKKEEGNKRFSTCWPFKQIVATKAQGTTQNLYFNENKTIKTVINKSAKKDLKNVHSVAAQSNQPSSTYEPNLPITAQTPKRALNAYNRAHTLPFLPSLICKYNLRDELLNLLNSSPFDEDRPIYSYCQLERWQPLRDVHQFMSEQVLSQSTENGPFKENIVDGVSTPDAFASGYTQPDADTSDLDKPGIGKAGVLSPNAQEQALAKRFFNSITQSASENSPDMVLNSFDSNSKKINGFSLQSEDKRAYAAWVRRIRDSARDASFLQVTEGVTKEYTLSEKLASLRHILYIALLEKDFSLRAKKLATRARKMSCFLTSIAREKLIHDSIQLSRFTETAFNKQNKTSKYESTYFNSTRSTERLYSNLRGSKALGKRIRATTYGSSKRPYQRFTESVLNLPDSTVKTDTAIRGGPNGLNSNFAAVTADNKSAVSVQSRNFFQPTRPDRHVQELLLSRRLRLRGKKTALNKHVYPFHYLLRRSSSRNLFASKIEDTLYSSNATKKKNTSLHVQTRVAQLQKMSSLIGLANTLQFKSPERSYRSLLFDKTWVRSFLLEKHLLDKKRYPTISVSKLLTLSKTQKGVMRSQTGPFFSPQIRSIPSYIHAFRQHANNKNQFNSYTLLIQNAWPLKRKITALNGVFTSGPIEPARQTANLLRRRYLRQQISARDMQNPVENLHWREYESVGQKTRSLSNNFVQQDCNIVNNTVKKSIGAHEKRLINRVYNLTFVLTRSGTEAVKEGFSTYQLIPPFTKFIETVNPTPSSDIGQIQSPLTAYAQTRENKLQDRAASSPKPAANLHRRRSHAGLAGRQLYGAEHNLPDEVQQKGEMLASSALSFFLVLPHSHKVQYSQTLRSVSTDKSANTQILENHKSLQRQLKNGNSQLLNRPAMLFSAFSHHVHTNLDSLEIAQKSFSNTVKLLKKSAAGSTSRFFSSQLPATIEASLTSADQVVNAIPPLNGKDFSESSQALQLSRNSVYGVPAAYRHRNFLRDSYNNDGAVYNNENALFGENTSVSGQGEYALNTGIPQRRNVFEKASLTREKATSSTQQKTKRVSASTNQINMSRQDSTFSSLELTTIREILSYTGGGALQKLLQRFDTQLFATFLSADIKATRATYKQKVLQKGYSPSRLQKRILTRLCRRIYKNSRRLKIAQLLTRCKRRPEWMMISVLPVLPPDLRPILQMSESVVVASDLNNLYQRVVYRNNRFYKLNFIDFYLVTAIQRLVQDAVDRLIENGKGGSKPFYTPGGRPLKSLSDTLKGKKGRFRLNLLGKRVDFSGRSVIVVSPSLKIHECGLPREIALELYHYFLLRQLMLRKQASSIIMAKKIIQQRDAFVWDVLRDIVYHHPVLLNRAPTLHRLGIQAFQPKLVKGNAILLNPLVCSGFNADFDGDQMGVHLPLSTQARAEAWDLLWSRNNLLSPATGQPVLVPSQDMVLGFYYMTQSFSSRSLFAIKEKKKDLLLERQQLGLNARQRDSISKNTIDRTTKKVSELQNNTRRVVSISFSPTPKDRRIPTARELVSASRVFFNYLELLKALQNKNIHLHTPVWLQWQGKMENDEGAQTPLELRINNFGSSTYIYSKYKRRKDESLSQSTLYIRTTAGRVLVNSILF